MSLPFLYPIDSDLEEVSIMGENRRFPFIGKEQLLLVAQTKVTYISRRECIDFSPFKAFRDGNINTFVSVNLDVSPRPMPFWEGRPSLIAR